MNHPFAAQLLQMLNNMVEMDLDDAPAMKFVGAFRKELLEYGYSTDTCEKIAGGMDVTLSVGSVDDETIAEYARLYARLVDKLLKAFRHQGFLAPEIAVLGNLRNLSLKLE